MDDRHTGPSNLNALHLNNVKAKDCRRVLLR